MAMYNVTIGYNFTYEMITRKMVLKQWDIIHSVRILADYLTTVNI